jgi:3-hydroxyisobutyrate dehydrogenase-like beta-hydroxyacid dehydrogenase
MTTRIALVGFGEVGQTLAADLADRGGTALIAWDPRFLNPSSGPALAIVTQGPRDRRVAPQAAANLAAGIAGCDLVISAVTAGECVAAAREAAASIAPGALYFDLNSVAPATKREAAHLIEAAGGHYVEAAVMSPIGPKRIASPMLLGGPHAASFAPRAHALGFVGAAVFADRIGPASAAKMCRSVMIKGIEALLTESLLAARHYGVESTVLDSLSDLFPGSDWPLLSRYMISRSLQHGRRRAEEMREVAKTVGDAGLDPWMSTACALRQDWAAGHREALAQHELGPLLDALLGRIAASAPPPAAPPIPDERSIPRATESR